MRAEPDVDRGQGPAADDRPGSAREVRGILAAAGRAGWHDRGRILAVTITVSLVTAGAEIVADHFIDPANDVLSVAGTLSAEALSLFGTILISGFLCRIVRQDRPRENEPGQGQPRPGQLAVSEIARTLPWARLAVADILVAILVGIGLVALVIPGLVVLNFCAVVGPVIEIEHRSVRSALRRSARLVRLHFWWVALLITVPVAALGEVESVLPDPHGLPAILEVLAARGIGEALVQTVIGLILVQVCFWLIDLDARSPHQPGPEPG